MKTFTNHNLMKTEGKQERREEEWTVLFEQPEHVELDGTVSPFSAKILICDL